MRTWLKAHWLDASLVIAGLIIALALRASLLEFKSVDFFNYTKGWYNTLQMEGFSAFGRDFSNYNLPYLYMLYAVVRFLPDVPPVVAVKIPSMVAEFVAAFVVFQIARTALKSRFISLTAAFCFLIAPTVVLNGAFWGQADAVYAAVLLACILFLLRRKNGLAMALFGLALALKAQSLFMAPLLVGLVLRRELRWRELIWIPAVFLVLLLPAWAAGRSPLEMLLIYPAQAGQYERLTLHAPSALAWIPDTGRYFRYFNAAGLILTAAAALAFIWAIYKSPAKLTPQLLIELALISVVLMPFCLPKMHERYFYMADVLSVMLAFVIPTLFYVPILMVTISFMAYQPTLFGAEPVSMGILALGVLLLLVVLLTDVAPKLAPESDQV